MVRMSAVDTPVKQLLPVGDVRLVGWQCGWRGEMASVAVAVKQKSCFRSKSRVLLERCQRVDAGWSVVTLSTPETCGVFPARDVLCW
jgi:hypothetical protein